MDYIDLKSSVLEQDTNRNTLKTPSSGTISSISTQKVKSPVFDMVIKMSAYNKKGD